MTADFLRYKVPFLVGLSEGHAAHLAVSAEERPFAPGQTVLFKGTTIDGLYVIMAGKVSVWVKPEKQKVLAQVATLGAGDVFGETSIIEMGTAGATIKAAEEPAVVLVIPQEAFRKVLAEDPAFAARASALIEARKKKSSENPASASA